MFWISHTIWVCLGYLSIRCVSLVTSIIIIKIRGRNFTNIFCWSWSFLIKNKQSFGKNDRVKTFSVNSKQKKHFCFKAALSCGSKTLRYLGLKQLLWAALAGPGWPPQILATARSEKPQPGCNIAKYTFLQEE